MAEESRWLSDLRSRVRAARKALGWSQEQLAERSELSVDMVSRVERGTRVPSLLVLRRIARAMDMNMVALLRGPEDATREHAREETWRSSVPLLGTVSAGLSDPVPGSHVGESVPVPPGCGMVDFALHVQGESMWGAGILGGDVVLVRRSASFHNGDIVVAMVDDEVRVKRLQITNGACLLLAESPRYPAAAVPAELNQLVGVVVGVLRTVASV